MGAEKGRRGGGGGVGCGRGAAAGAGGVVMTPAELRTSHPAWVFTTTPG